MSYCHFFIFFSVITLYFIFFDRNNFRNRKIYHPKSLRSTEFPGENTSIIIPTGSKSITKRNEKTNVTIPSKTTLRLDTIALGKSKALDYKNENYVFVVAKPENDIFVSTAMLTDVGWEPELNTFFDDLVRSFTSRNNVEKNRLHVVDVGANFGAFSLHVASQHIGVDSFEMQPFVYSCLKMSKKLNAYNHWNIFHAALWDIAGQDVSFRPLTGNYGGTSLISKSKSPSNEEEVTMKSKRLDELISVDKNIFFFKIDAEGAEINILRGFESAFRKKKISHVLIEIRNNGNNPEVVDFLYSHDLECTEIVSDMSLFNKFYNRTEMLEVFKKIGHIGNFYCTTKYTLNSFKSEIFPKQKI